MEIRARYILMGIFLLAVISGVFGFVYWLENAGSFRERITYRIMFNGPVSGLYTGSSVHFNGIRVGEVMALRLRADRPNEVAALIAVDPNTPIRTDTMVDLEYQGLTGIAAISLTGGKSGASLVSSGDGIPTLNARQGAGTTITQSARDALIKLHGILDDNSQPLKELIGNLNDFSGALSRNSGKVDGILAGLERMTGGKRSEGTDKVFDLSAPQQFAEAGQPFKSQLSVPLPSALFQLDTQNILFRPSRDDAPLPPGPRWADNLTRLLQAKITQSFENAGYIRKVSQSDVVSGDYQLLIDIRRFQIVSLPEPHADIAFSARIADIGGKVIDAKLFEAAAPAKSTKPEPAVAALDQAFKDIALELVGWTADVMAKAAAEAEAAAAVSEAETLPDEGVAPEPLAEKPAAVEPDATASDAGNPSASNNGVAANGDAAAPSDDGASDVTDAATSEDSAAADGAGQEPADNASTANSSASDAATVRTAPDVTAPEAASGPDSNGEAVAAPASGVVRGEETATRPAVGEGTGSGG